MFKNNNLSYTSQNHSGMPHNDIEFYVPHESTHTHTHTCTQTLTSTLWLGLKEAVTWCAPSENQ